MTSYQPDYNQNQFYLNQSSGWQGRFKVQDYSPSQFSDVPSSSIQGDQQVLYRDSISQSSSSCQTHDFQSSNFALMSTTLQEGFQAQAWPSSRSNLPTASCMSLQEPQTGMQIIWFIPLNKLN